VPDRGAKLDLAARTGADLVDLESAAFARAATAAGWRWLIVRGVSDELNDRLPPSLQSWVGHDGQAKWRSVVAGVIRRPTAIPALRRLQRSGQAGMFRAATVIDRMIDRDIAEQPQDHWRS
jgi:hypothetical protein